MRFAETAVGNWSCIHLSGSHARQQAVFSRCRLLPANIDAAAAAAAEGNTNRAGYAAAERRGWPKFGKQKAVLDAAAKRFILLAGSAYDGKVDNLALVVK